MPLWAGVLSISIWEETLGQKKDMLEIKKQSCDFRTPREEPLDVAKERSVWAPLLRLLARP